MNAKICKELRHAVGLFPRTKPRVATEYEPFLFRPRGVERMTLAGVELVQMAWPVAVKLKKGSPRHIYKALKRMHRRGLPAPASLLLGATV